MDGDSWDSLWRLYAGAFGMHSGRHMSAAGQLLERLDNAEKAITEASDITDELRCALRRADIKAMRA